MEFLYFLLIGAISGWLAGQFWRGSGFGLIGDIIIGIVGGVFGGWLAGKLGIATDGGVIVQILVAAVGAWILLFIIGMIRGNK
ncbi:GlsB/YeaQ/YmgE family stress response membrane protein [Flavobacterium sp. LMO8]|uniref:GlsB/YeaQ/YmgE family stress response membrane protein n=1 Tax=Flavobacterium sp. LMO8 TaxID=2654244 RepID=UPI001290BDBC|nr:GlsB/YeaQ/YmgE family stress response membrane protein [Flavobacterium sp. LMO8]MQP25279.1 GlsB/YeaQ/YmgE family stress response membrane protein [Flavobacterium sp. LMO8]